MEPDTVHFSNSTRVSPSHTSMDEGATYSGEIHPGWEIFGNANGGYLMVLAARALSMHLERAEPVSVSAHYLRPGQPGPVTIRCQNIKSGRRFGTGTATLSSGGRPLLQLLGTFGDPPSHESEPRLCQGAPPLLPPPEKCIVSRHGQDGAPPFSDRVHVHLHPDDAGFRLGQPSGVARMRGWFRLRDGEPLDAFALLLAADAFPPTIFNARLPMSWTPTLELTVHVRARPCSEWLRAQFVTRFVSHGRLEEDGELWDAEGNLVAQSRQLALAPLD